MPNQKFNITDKGLKFLLFSDAENLHDKILSDYQQSLKKQNKSDNRSFVTEIEAIHAITTGNYTEFIETELRGKKSKKTGKYSWTDPYNKPVLLYHNQRDGEAIGRVLDASFSRATKTGIPGIKLKAEINDLEAIKKIEDERYKTVSIGAYAERAECSICGKDWVNNGWCEHVPGNEYEEEGTMTLILRDIVFVEVSIVNIPADEYAEITDFYYKDISSNKNNRKKMQESYILFDSSFENFQNYKSNKKRTEQTGGLKMEKTLEEKLQVKEEKIEMLNEKIEKLEEKNKNLDSTISILKEEKEVLEGKNENLEDDIVELNKNIKKLKEKNHKHLAQNVVEMKIEMGKVRNLGKENFKEDLIKEHIERSEDSLRDSLKDLEAEKKLNKESNQNNNQVEDPGLNVEDDNGQVIDDNISDELDEEFKKIV